jgi:hypothetical protein
MMSDRGHACMQATSGLPCGPHQVCLPACCRRCLSWCNRLDQFNLSLDPVTARAFHDATLPQEPAKVRLGGGRTVHCPFG